jgi:hypothetical protein
MSLLGKDCQGCACLHPRGWEQCVALWCKQCWHTWGACAMCLRDCCDCQDLGRGVSRLPSAASGACIVQVPALLAGGLLALRSQVTHAHLAAGLCACMPTQAVLLCQLRYLQSAFQCDLGYQYSTLG